MEPERKIEKLLRAYAKRRRADAGEPLSLHPADRRRLQDAIARREVGAGDHSLFRLLFATFRRRLAFCLCMISFVAIALSLLLPAFQAAKSKVRREIAGTGYHLQQIGAAVRLFAEENNGRLPNSLDDLTNELQPDLKDLILTDPQNGKRYIYITGGIDLNVLPSNAVLAYSLPINNTQVVLFANGEVERVGQERFLALMNRGQFEMASADTANRRSPAPTPVPMPAAPAVAPPASMASVSQPLEKSEAAATTGESNNQNLDKVDFKLAELKSPSPGPAAGGMGGSGGLAANAPMQTQEFRQALARQGGVYGNGAAAGTASQRFVQTGLTFARQDRFLQAEARGQTPSVLASFQVRQQGEALSVVDQDGSVYHGSLSVNEAPFPTGQPAAEVPAAKLGAPPVQTAPGRLAGKSPPSNQNYSFRVAGTNQTLQQAVVFTGNLVTVSNAPASPAQALWSNSRIVGTVVVANTNAVEINAVPVAP